MQQSPYLQQLMQATQAPVQQPSIDPAMLAQVIQRRKADPAAPRGLSAAVQNVKGLPGQVMGNLRQAGQNVMNVPQTLGEIPGQVGANLAQLPGLFGLGQRGIR